MKVSVMELEDMEVIEIERKGCYRVKTGFKVTFDCTDVKRVLSVGSQIVVLSDNDRYIGNISYFDSSLELSVSRQFRLSKK